MGVGLPLGCGVGLRAGFGGCWGFAFRGSCGFCGGGSSVRVAALVVVLLAVAGCSPSSDKTTAVAPAGGGVTGVPGETTSAPALAAPEPALTKAAPRRSPAKRLHVELPSSGRFVAAVQRQMPQFVVDRRDDEVAELGEIACRSLAAGKRESVVARAITGYGVGERDARELVVLARDNACRLSAKS
ncbi:DUF732 domain-containing protein [Actinoplanes sp. TBRC 11911]|uniref:DUF732 domain-containing protein n=1 Tax=Actinoplanes sp. TBRC 11911 TaxID=2729386 RepID=UPI00145DE663|nr:DUF732 domain-containing protein [Actinoplanes sp. TBRC 11911]NMO56648.1 DUF732 domain-containing protein [Actinoplanes sp. TBRC 11911]